MWQGDGPTAWGVLRPDSRSLAGAGFEAACISPARSGSERERRRNPALDSHRRERRRCHVSPVRLNGSAENAMLVAAYLGRPMILRGHHQDLKGGLELLDGYAA